MAKDLINKLLDEAIETDGTYVEFIVSDGNLTFISDCGSRRSTRNYKIDDNNVDICERLLKKLDARSLLFSGSIKRIKYVLRDKREGVFERKNEGNIYTVTGKKVNEEKTKETSWACFVDNLDNKTGVAFELGKVRGKKQIVPCKGTIMNGLFDSGLMSDLRFIVSGNFVDESMPVAKKQKDINKISARKTGAVLEHAIPSMISLGLLGNSLFSVLPCTMDDDSDINMELISATKKACDNRPLFKNGIGTIVGKDKVILGTTEVTGLFPQNLIDQLGIGKYWIEGCSEGSRENYFFIDIGIPYFDRELFLFELSSEEYFDDLSVLLSKQNDKWLKDFYIFCSSPYSDNEIKKRVMSALKNIQSIRDSKGKMYFPYEISIMNENDHSVNGSLVVNNKILFTKGKEDKYSNQLIEFFINDLGIKQYSDKAGIEKLAKDLTTKKQSIDRLYCEKLLRLAKYDLENAGEIDFADFSIFPCKISRGITRAKAKEIVISKPFVDEGTLIAKIFDRKQLWSGIKEFISEDELNLIIRFAMNNGAVGMPVVVKQNAERHIDFKKSLFMEGSQKRRDSSFDYIIPGLNEIIKRRSLRLNKMIWNAIIHMEDPEKVIWAEYSVENRKMVKRDYSSLIKILRNYTWILGKDGKFYSPEDINISDISDEFSFDKRNPILKELGFGTGIGKKKSDINTIKKLAEKEGLCLVPLEEYQEFLAWQNSKRR